MLGDHDLEPAGLGEATCRLEPAAAQSGPKRRIVAEAVDRRSESVDVARLEDQRVSLVLEVLTGPSPARGDDRPPDRHRLERHQPPWLDPLDWEDDRVR